MKYPDEFARLSRDSQKELTGLMTALKKFSSECSKAGVSTKPLTKLLSTIYGQTLVERGYLAIMLEKNSSMPVHLSRQVWNDYLTWIMDENHLTDWILKNAEDGLEIK